MQPRLGDEPTAIEVSWFWDWVPATGRTDAERTAWIGYVAGLVDGWAGEKVAAARAAWPADAPTPFPFTVDEMGSAVASDLLGRADQLSANARLIWGAAFLGDTVRWLPLLVVAEFRRARPGDPDYLMAAVGAEGFDEDVREPNVDYVSTAHGDGIRVLALARSESEGVYCRVNGALRLDGPPADVDVLLTTRALGMDQIAVIGYGIEALMNMIADQFGARPGDGAAPLRFDVLAGRDQS